MLNEKFLEVLLRNHKKLESWRMKMKSCRKLKEKKGIARNLLNKKLCEVDIPRKWKQKTVKNIKKMWKVVRNHQKWEWERECLKEKEGEEGLTMLKKV